MLFDLELSHSVSYFALFSTIHVCMADILHLPMRFFPTIQLQFVTWLRVIGEWNYWKLVWLFFEKLLHARKFVVAWKRLHWFSGTDQRGFWNFDSNLCGYDWDGDGSCSRKKSPDPGKLSSLKSCSFLYSNN